MMSKRSSLRPWAVLVCAAWTMAPPARAESRGELLYTTHCIGCHTTEMHWRDNRVANDWVGLKFQVRRWQDAASLQWNENDVVEVARYLNETIYHFSQTSNSQSLLHPPIDAADIVNRWSVGNAASPPRSPRR
jgi:hypothetical protein